MSPNFRSSRSFGQFRLEHPCMMVHLESIITVVDRAGLHAAWAKCRAARCKMLKVDTSGMASLWHHNFSPQNDKNYTTTFRSTGYVYVIPWRRQSIADRVCFCSDRFTFDLWVRAFACRFSRNQGGQNTVFRFIHLWTAFHCVLATDRL